MNPVLRMCPIVFIKPNASSSTWFTSVLRPAEFILSTHAPQRPQVSVRLTIKASGNAKPLVGKVESASVPIKIHDEALQTPI